MKTQQPVLSYQTPPFKWVFYFQVDITENFFDNVLKMFKHFRTNIYHFVNMPVERETYTWNLISYPFTVNAFHLQQLNSIGEYCYLDISLAYFSCFSGENSWRVRCSSAFMAKVQLISEWLFTVNTFHLQQVNSIGEYC